MSRLFYLWYYKMMIRFLLNLQSIVMEKKLENIEHPGVVEDISGKNVMVRIKSRTACGDCKSKSYCGLQDVKDKIIDIETSKAADYKIGQKITVTLKQSLGYKAVLLGYMVPLVILIMALIVMITLTGNEPLSALIAVLIMVPYYVMVYLKRHKLRKTFNFHIKE